MNEKLRIELCSDTGLGKEPFYAELELPATAEQIRDAKQRARIVSADDAGSVSISIIEFDPIPELEEVRLDTTTVEELNFLAMRMDALCEEQFLVYRALFDKRFEDMGSDGLLSVKDLINMTYGIDDVVVASGINTDEQLGQFVIENDLHPDIAAIPDDSLYPMRIEDGCEPRRERRLSSRTSCRCVGFFGGEQWMSPPNESSRI